MTGLRCPFILKTTVLRCGRGGETSAEFFPCIWLPRHEDTAPPWPLSMGLKISIYLLTAAVRPGPTATVFLEISEGVGVESPAAAPSLCWGFLYK